MAADQFELDLGKVRATDEEISKMMLEVTGGLHFGKDSDGNWGYIEPGEGGADAVIPFRKSGGSVSGVEQIFFWNGTAPVSSTLYHKDLGSVVLEKDYSALIVVCVGVGSNNYSCTVSDESDFSPTSFWYNYAGGTTPFSGDAYFAPSNGRFVAGSEVGFKLNHRGSSNASAYTMTMRYYCYGIY